MRLCFAYFYTMWLTSVASSEFPEFKMVCYFASWVNYGNENGGFDLADVDPNLCTHLIYAFIGITTNGDIDFSPKQNDLADEGGEFGLKKFVALRKFSPKTKFMVAIGGWNEGSVKYSTVMANTLLRSNFVKNVVNFTLHYELDGVDMDWEYPNQRNGIEADVENFVLLLEELRAVFDENGLILSAAVAAAESSASLSYNIPEISKNLNFMNLMTYDFHGSWDSTTGHNAPLYPAGRETSELQRSLNINASVNYWLEQGAPSEKLVLGIAFYGRTFALNNSAENYPGSSSRGAGQAGKESNEKGTLFYYEICELTANESWTIDWDPEQHVPYAYLGDQWISYDNVKSVTEKANYVKSVGLGGAMIWTINEDDFRGVCGEPNALLNAVNVAVQGNKSSVEFFPQRKQSEVNYTSGVGSIAISFEVRMLTLILGIEQLVEMLRR